MRIPPGTCCPDGHLGSAGTPPTQRQAASCSSLLHPAACFLPCWTSPADVKQFCLARQEEPGSHGASAVIARSFRGVAQKIYQLEEQRTSRADFWATRKEVPPNKCLEDAGLSTALTSDDCNLRQVGREINPHLLQSFRH